jgi:hypothetical protein
LSPSAKYLGGASTAFKGISYLNHPTPDTFRFSTIACDQRLSIWEVNELNMKSFSNNEELEWANIPFHFPNEDGSSVVENISEPSQFFFPALSPALQYSTPTIKWISGSISHVTEISSMSVAPPLDNNLCAIVIGEGFELISISK